MVLGWGSKKAQVQHDDEDMSMEEILASIRKYVAEETPNKESAAISPSDTNSPYRTEMVRPQPNASPSSAQYDEPTLSPKNSFEESSLFDSSSTDTVAETYPVTRETLTQKTTDPVAHNPFAKLAEISKKDSPSLSPQSSQTLDQLIGELAKPMIQNWINQNLSQIVEKMVADEIARMTRG